MNDVCPGWSPPPCLLSLHPPCSGSLERSEAEPWGHPSPRFMPWHPETGFPWPAVTQDVCVCTCKCGCMCVRIVLISVGNLGVGLEEMGNRMSSSLSPSGKKNQEASL